MHLHIEACSSVYLRFILLIGSFFCWPSTLTEWDILWPSAGWIAISQHFLLHCGYFPSVYMKGGGSPRAQTKLPIKSDYNNNNNDNRFFFHFLFNSQPNWNHAFKLCRSNFSWDIHYLQQDAFGKLAAQYTVNKCLFSVAIWMQFIYFY